MPKRKSQQNVPESDSDSDVKVVDVDFDFCDFKPETDYISIKRLLQQLFHTDATLFDLGAIADVILSQDDVGSTVKTDGVDSDPLAFLGVLNLYVDSKKIAIKSLLDYLLSKISVNVEFHRSLTTLLNQMSPTSPHIGLIIGERVYNMPPQVMPPSYKMLLEEMQVASDDGKPYRFSHFLILSRVWKSTAGEEDEPSAPSSKKRKVIETSVNNSLSRTYNLHPEDECIQPVRAMFSLDFDFSHQFPREKDSFGHDLGGRIMLVSKDRLPQVVQNMQGAFPPPS
ncbi:hypothetical protein CPB86DRAFT_706801 [Serendipita vermifera]|nr:hypothetical protein CPB86DRAFT_706801 [Serendipita vermifera]